MLNIVFISPHSDPEAKTGEIDSGGQCIYEYELAKVLAMSKDVSVTVYCRKRGSHPSVSIVTERFLIKRITLQGDALIPKEKIGVYLDEFAIKVVEDLHGVAPDIIHGHYWDGGKAALLVASKLAADIPLVWTPHSLGNAKRLDYRGSENEMKYWFSPRICWETYAMIASQAVIVSTTDEQERVTREYGIESDKVKIISPGIAHNNFKKVSQIRARRKLGLPINVPIVMSLGRLDSRKGYHNAIKAFAEFNRLFKRDARLALFVGNLSALTPDEAAYLDTLKELTRTLEIQDKVLFKSAVDYKDVHYIYAASNAYLCLSEYEPFGLSIIEAMYMGVPVIATNNGGPRTIITQNYNGVVVNPHDATYTAYSLYLVLYDMYLNSLIISNAKGFIRHKYTWTSRARDFLAVYERLKALPSHEKRREFLDYVVSRGSTL